MTKKVLFIVVALAMVLSSFASVLVAPTVTADAEPPVIQDLHWWSNVSGDIPDVTAYSSAKSLAVVGQTATIPASKDTAVGFSSVVSPDANYGSRISFVAWNYSPYADLDSLLEFSLDQLPADAEIYYAELQLYSFNVGGSSYIPIDVYKQLHTDWEELQATYNIYKTGSNWTAQGGDYVTSNPAGTEATVPPNSQEWVQWNITNIVNDARIRNIPVELLVKAIEYGSAHSDVGFYSKEYSDSSVQPRLVIEYTSNESPTPTPTPTSWSFAIITDTHIGESEGDFGASGWDDSNDSYTNYPNSMNDQGLKNLISSVSQINNSINASNPNHIKFVVVLGDLTSSAEISEMQASIDVLNTLSVPWLPIIGNHDVWPYTGKCNILGCDGTEFPRPISGGIGSDYYFNDMLSSAYQNFSDKLGLISTWKELTYVKNRGTDPNCYSYFQNLAFDYGGFHFIGLDFNDRSHAPDTWPILNKGVAGWAKLYDFPGSTLNWFEQHLTDYLNNPANQGQGKNIIILSHNPFVVPFPLNLGNLLTGFSDDLSPLTTFLSSYAGNLSIQFAGHYHPGDSGGSRKTYTAELKSFPVDIMPCVTIPGNLNKPWVQIANLNPSDKSVNYSEDLFPAITYSAHCPVELTVTDPDNLVISKDINQIPGAMYITNEYDENGNSSPCNEVWIPNRKLGNYSIQVIPQTNASASDTFTLTASPTEDKWGDTPITLAQNVTISNIPAEPYTFEVKQRTATNLTYTGVISGYKFDTVNLTAALSTDNGSPLSGKTINFVIENQSVSAVTDSNGVASASLTLNQTPSQFYYVECGFDGDKDYLPYYGNQPFVIPPIADAGRPYTGTEGSPITLNGSGTYDPEGRVISYEWDLDNDGVYDDATGAAPAYTWKDDLSGPISLMVTDNMGATSTATTTVTINNVPPIVEAGVDISNAIAGTPLNFSGSFTDPGQLDTHTIVWNFGDGSPTVNGTLIPSHTYTSRGNYTVTLTVTDNNGGIGTDTVAINVIPPPPSTTTYTFTTGGGVNKWCWEGHVHLIDWNNGHPSSPSDFANSYGYTLGGSSAYSAVSSLDSSSWRSNISHDLGCCAFDRNCELFKFKINESPSSITNIKIKWIGHGTTGETIYYTTEKLWRVSNNTWNKLNDQTNIKSDTTWTNNISSSCSNYIDSTGNLSILVASQRSGLPNNCGIWTNYIEVTITHN